MARCVPGVRVFFTLNRGLVWGPRGYQDQFRGCKSHQVHACRGLFLHKTNYQRKARERELATFDERGKSTSSGNAEPLWAMTPVTTACPEVC